MTVKEINELIENDYIQKNIHTVHDDWFPLMKYDEDYGVFKSFDEIKAVTLGLNPSLTENFAKTIHNEILEIEKHFGFKNESKFGIKRYEAYTKNKAAVTKKLIAFQSQLKYDDNEKISYFKQLETFFNELQDGINFKEHVFHYDFCQLRHTDSKQMKTTIKENYKTLVGHLEKIIELVQPKIIFIFNASLATLLKENNFFSTSILDPELGCYFYKNTPVILANQLSGGATSSVYRELLIWNVNRILNKK
jgi:hypothetical protein